MTVKTFLQPKIIQNLSHTLGKKIIYLGSESVGLLCSGFLSEAFTDHTEVA